MLKIVYILLAISMAAVVFTLVMGGKSMVTHTEDRSTSNKWMWRRIWAQGIAIALLALTVVVKKNGG